MLPVREHASIAKQTARYGAGARVRSACTPSYTTRADMLCKLLRRLIGGFRFVDSASPSQPGNKPNCTPARGSATGEIRPHTVVNASFNNFAKGLASFRHQYPA